MRVFLDANILFSASNPGSNIARLIDWVLEQDTAVASESAIEEARRNIDLKRPAWAETFERVTSCVEIVESIAFQIPVELTEKDIPILCAAIRGRCQVLATGETNLPTYQSFQTDISTFLSDIQTAGGTTTGTTSGLMALKGSSMFVKGALSADMVSCGSSSTPLSPSGVPEPTAAVLRAIASGAVFLLSARRVRRTA